MVTLASAFGAAPAGAQISDTPRNFWGVEGLDPNATTAVQSEVWAIEQVGNTIYVGGKFLAVTGGTATFDQPFLAAFHADSGKWISWWRPELNGSVYALQASADGSKLFVGGDFTEVNGATHEALVVLNPATGNVVPWSTEVSSDGRAVIRAMDAAGPWIYIGGSFRTATDSAGVARTVNHAARMNVNTGALDLAWRPVVQGGGVWGMAVSPDLPRVYLAGFFTAVDNTAGTGWAAGVDSTTGAPVPGIMHVSNTTGFEYQHDVEVANGLVFIGGSQHNVHVYRESDFELLKTHMTRNGGDIQDMELVGDRVYVTCHCFNFNYEFDGLQNWPSPDPNAIERPVRAVMALDATTGAQDPDFYVDLTGSAGAWAVHGNESDGCLWVGGDMTTSGGTPTDALVRLCDEAGPGPAAGPRLTPPPPTSCAATAVANNDVNLTWPAVEFADYYVIYRNGSWLARIPATQLSYLDTTPVVGPTYTYSVATQANGDNSNPRRTCSPSISFAAPTPTAVTSCTASPADSSASVSWVRAPADNASAFVIYRSLNGGNFFWRARVNAPATSFVDTNVSTGSTYTYRVITQGLGQNAAAVTCSPSVTITPDTGSAPVPVSSCSVTEVAGSASVSWVRAGNDNAERFIIHRSRNGGTFFWRARVDTPATSFLDSNVAAGSTYRYRVTTQGGGQNAAAVTCTPAVTIGAGSAPAAVTSCTASRTGNTASIQWVRAGNDNAERFILFRSRNGGTFFWLGRVDAPATSFNDTNLASGSTYTYRVVTQGGGVNSAPRVCG